MIHPSKLAAILNKALHQAYLYDGADLVEQIAVACASELQQNFPEFRPGEFLAMVARDPETEAHNVGKYSLLPRPIAATRA